MGAGASFSRSSSGPKTWNPWGQLPYDLGYGAAGQFARPLVRGFGYQQGAGPLATFINQGDPLTRGYIPQMQNLSTTLTTGANQTYGGYQNAIDNFMQQLPGFQQTAATATGGATDALNYARTAASDAFSPLQSRASFQEASRRALAPAREGAAARGMLEGGQAQAGEQSLLSDLAFRALQGDREAQQQAITGLSGAAQGVGAAGQGQAAIASMGPQMEQALFSAYPQLAQLLTSSAQLPFQGMNQLLQFFSAANNPIFQLLNMLKPQMGVESRSISQSAGGGATGG